MLGDANIVLDVLLSVVTTELTGYTTIIWDSLDVRDTIRTNMGVTNKELRGLLAEMHCR